MRFAFSRPTADEDQQRRLFAGFGDMGYDGLQLKAGQYARYLDAPGDFIGEWGACPGAAAGLITGGNLDEASVARLRKVLQFAQAIGSELVVYCLMVPREGLSDDDIRSAARRMSTLGAEARQLGTRLSLHNHFDSPVMHRADFDVFYEAAEPGQVGLTLDTAHLAKSGVADIAEVIRSFAGVIDNFHLKDFADGQWRVLGEGDIAFGPVFEAIRAIGYDGWVSTDEESGGEMIPTMESCLAIMRSALT